MKKLTSALLIFILAISMALSLSGCKKDEEGASYSLDEIPSYSGQAYVIINENNPFFTQEEIKVSSLEEYSRLDALGRCGVAIACIGLETMPTEDREEIGSVTPSGWEYNDVSNNKKYDFVDNGYVYNRCHLIGFQLAGENANEKNLITGTRYLNIEGMLPFENQIAAYVKATGNHVLYRVTPIYNGEDLVASGVLMEGISVEDNGGGVKFCVYAFNVQPGVTINYFTGQNVPSGESLPPVYEDAEEEYFYVINTNSKTVHKSTCSHASKISEANRAEFNGDISLLFEMYENYGVCGSCLPDVIVPTPDPEAPEQTPEEDLPEADEDTAEDITYILNTNSKKIHLPSCSNIPTNEANRLDYFGTLEELKAEYPDYTGCGSCKPDLNP